MENKRENINVICVIIYAFQLGDSQCSAVRMKEKDPSHIKNIKIMYLKVVEQMSRYRKYLGSLELLWKCERRTNRPTDFRWRQRMFSRNVIKMPSLMNRYNTPQHMR